jgi:hypothetical protein
MRSLGLLALLAAPALAEAPPAAVAGEERAGCSVHLSSGARLVRTGDVEIAPGDRARDVVALRGHARVKAGAEAGEVVALGGDVIVEDGATVRGDAISFGGDVRLATGARVEGRATSVGGRLHLAEGAVIVGDRAHVRAEVNGRDLAARLVEGFASVLGALDCRLEIHEAD